MKDSEIFIIHLSGIEKFNSASKCGIKYYEFVT